MAIAAIVDFFDSVPQTVQDRYELEQWARENVEEASHIIGKYAREKALKEEQYIRARTRETQLILAEEYFTDEQKVRLVAAFHPSGDLDGQWHKYGVTLADEYLLEGMLYDMEHYEHDRDISYALLASCFEYVRNSIDDPWLVEAVQEWDETMERIQEKWSRDDDHPAGR